MKKSVGKIFHKHPVIPFARSGQVGFVFTSETIIRIHTQTHTPTHTKSTQSFGALAMSITYSILKIDLISLHNSKSKLHTILTITDTPTMVTCTTGHDCTEQTPYGVHVTHGTKLFTCTMHSYR